MPSSDEDMKKLVLRPAIFAIPFLIYMGLVWLVDPFNYYRPASMVDTALKLDTAYRLDSHIWKAIEFRRQPAANLILGDSRANHLSAEKVTKITGEPYYNFAYGGGRLSEMIDTFWLASRKIKLKNAYFCINFYRYNGTETMNLVPQSLKASSNLFNYSFSKQTFKLTFRLLYAHLADEQFQIGTPGATREEFWQAQLNKARRNYKNYQHPKKYFADLTKISEYCEQHGIGLHFLILPTHVELQEKIAEFGLRKDEQVFKDDLCKLGPVIDFNYPNDFTRNRDNFADPFHFKGDGGVIREVWSGRLVWGKVLPRK